MLVALLGIISFLLEVFAGMCRISKVNMSVHGFEEDKEFNLLANEVQIRKQRLLNLSYGLIQ